MTKPVTLIAAVAANGVIGDGPRIPWHLPGELAEFKQLTLGNILIMGRATYESIGRPLPGRTTVVLTRSPEWHADGVLVAATLDEAFALAESLPGEVMVAGGGQVYAAALPYATWQILTRVPLEPEGDVRYPDFDASAWEEVRRDAHTGYDRVWLHRRDSSVGAPS